MQAVQLQLLPARNLFARMAQAIANPENDWITRPLIAFAISRFIVFFSGYLAEVAIPGIIGDGLYHVNPNNVFLDIWARWDSGFYLRISQSGYWFMPGLQSGVAFFPVYPLLINLLSPFVGGMLAAGVLVSNTALYLALVFLYKLTELEFGKSAAGRTVMYIAVFPTAFFFTAVYTESLFLLLSVGTMYFARKQQWAWAALFGLICSASRIVGVLMFGVVVLEWLGAHGWLLTRMHQKQSWLNLWQGLRQDGLTLVMLGIMPLGLLSYMLFLNQQFSDPVAFSTTQSAWGRKMVGPVASVMTDLGRLLSSDFSKGDVGYHILLDVGAFAVVLIIAAAIWRRLGASYAIYSLLSMLIPASSGTGSLSRYALMVFPMFMMLGLWGKRTWLDRSLLVLFSVLMGMLTSLFVNWIFVA